MFCGCKNTTDKNVASSPITIEIHGYDMSLSEYNFQVSNDSGVVWYYPYQYLVRFKITNHSKHSSFLAIDDNMFNKGKKFTECSLLLNGIRYDVGSQTRIIIRPKKTIIITVFMIDYPLFKKPHSKKEFKKEFEYLVNNAIYEFQFFENDYLSDTVHVESNFKIFPILLGANSIKVSQKSKDFKVAFWKDFEEYDINDVGFPFDSIPSSVSVIVPIEGIDY